MISFLLCLILQSKESWHTLNDFPYWEGYGIICPVCKTIVPTKWRYIYNRELEIEPRDIYKYVAEPNSDQYGFTDWLNGVRASYGLSTVSYDPDLSAWADENNKMQNIYGIGHHVMGIATRQNSAMGSYPGINYQWMGSPAHRAALLDPNIRWIGIAISGAYATFNGR